MEGAFLLQPDLRGLVVDELVDQPLQVLGQGDLDDAHHFFLPVEIGRRVDLVFVQQGEQLLVLLRRTALPLRRSSGTGAGAAAGSRAPRTRRPAA